MTKKTRDNLLLWTTWEEQKIYLDKCLIQATESLKDKPYGIYAVSSSIFKDDTLQDDLHKLGYAP